jgi:hypothetical protein
MALSIAPVHDPSEPVIVRGRVAEWLEGDAAREIVDQLSGPLRILCRLTRETGNRGSWQAGG